MKMVSQILILLLAVLIAVLYFKQTLAPIKPKDLSIGQVCYDDKCFSVELATTKAQRDYGLMDRKSLDKDKGMLFVFDKEGIYPFWMKNTLILLDIIWVDSLGKVVHIKENAQPCRALFCPSITPSQKSKYVLEINAGICKEIGLKVGDKVKIKTD